jgi:hypothetical protein
MFYLTSITYFSCNSLSYSFKYLWSVSRTDIMKTIDLISNPTWQSSELVIQPNTLEYGSYKFSLNLTAVTFGDKSETTTTSISRLIQIVPTGIKVNAIRNGISSVLIGLQQNFTLNPELYSSDLDNVILASQLRFKFYCSPRLLNSSITLSQTIDLFKYKNGSHLMMSRNTTCFESNSEKFMF